MTKILLIEDNEGTALLVKTSLEDEGIEVDIAYNGEDALSLAKQNSYDIFITDKNLPDISGVELAESLAGIFPEIPTIMLSGSQEQEISGDTQRHYIDVFVEKTVGLDFLDNIKSHIKTLKNRQT